MTMDSPFPFWLSPALPSSALQPSFPNCARDWRCRGPSTARWADTPSCRAGGAPDPSMNSTSTTFPIRRRAGCGRHKTSGGLLPARGLYRTGRQGPADDVAGIDANLRPAVTEATGCRFSTAAGREHLGAGAFMASRRGGNGHDLRRQNPLRSDRLYGVNIFGMTFTRNASPSRGAWPTALGPVLGPYHPVVAD